MFQKLVLLFVLFAHCKCSYRRVGDNKLEGRKDDNIDECSLEESELPNLQMLFLVDAALSKQSVWPNIQGNLTQEILQLAEGNYKAEYALASYNNWEDGNCYKMLSDFTKDIVEIARMVYKLPENSDHDVVNSECSLTMGLVMASADKNLHWNNELYTVSKTPTRKVIVTFPLKVSTTELSSSEGRRQPVGDGTDTCENSLPPTPETLKRIFDANNMYILLGGVEVFGREQDFLLNHYLEMFTMGQFGGTFVAFDDPDTGERRGFKAEDIYSINYEQTGEQIFDSLVQEMPKCFFEDPPAYNTLGK